MKQIELCQNTRKVRKWSGFNAPGIENYVSHPFLQLEEFPFLTTDVPGYTDTGYSDNPIIVTLWAGPKSIITVRNRPLTVTPRLQ